jgi:preprotein translocase subunit SecD
MAAVRRTAGLACALAIAVAGCGGGSHPAPPPAAPEVALYDWEPNVIGSDGKPLGEHAVDYTPARIPIRKRTDAVARAATAKGITGGPVVVLRAPGAPGQAASAKGWFVIRDKPALDGSQLTRPRQNFDPQTNEPIVIFGFTREGRTAFARVTRRIAERGTQTILPPGTPRRSAFQHLAITVGRQVVSLTAIDFVANPNGIDGSSGAEIAGIGTIQQGQRLARALRSAASGR